MPWNFPTPVRHRPITAITVADRRDSFQASDALAFSGRRAGDASFTRELPMGLVGEPGYPPAVLVAESGYPPMA